jgi:hypothetical protein
MIILPEEKGKNLFSDLSVLHRKNKTGLPPQTAPLKATT